MSSLREYFKTDYKCELDVLCRVIRSTLDLEPEDCATIKGLITSSFDWQFFYQAASYHGVVPLVVATIDKYLKEVVPNEQRLLLSKLGDQLARQNLLLLGEMFQMQDLFEAEGIPFVSFKGALVAVPYYGDLFLRPFSDLDLLVDHSNLDKTQDLLLRRGYKRIPDLAHIHTETFYRSSQFKESTNEQTFRLGGSSGIVDVHWKVQPTHFLDIDTAEVLDSCVEVNVHGRSLKTLPVELGLIVLFAHASKHNWRQLMWACDIRQILLKEQINWSELFRLAKRFDVTNMVLLGLCLAEDLVGAKLPPEVIDLVHDSAVAKSAAGEIAAKLHILSDGCNGLRAFTWQLHMRLRTRLKNKISFAYEEFLKPNIADLNRVQLPAYLFALYYLLHPFWLVSDACRRRMSTMKA